MEVEVHVLFKKENVLPFLIVKEYFCNAGGVVFVFSNFLDNSVYNLVIAVSSFWCTSTFSTPGLIMHCGLLWFLSFSTSLVYNIDLFWNKKSSKFCKLRNEDRQTKNITKIVGKIKTVLERNYHFSRGSNGALHRIIPYFCAAKRLIPSTL